MAYHFFLLQLNPFALRIDREGWWFYLYTTINKVYIYFVNGSIQVKPPSLPINSKGKGIEL